MPKSVSAALHTFRYVGLDDHWQNCTTVCANGTVIPSWLVKNGFTYQSCDNGTGSFSYPWYDNATGAPIFDTHRFPDVKGMTDKMHQMA